jgi:hypothetical protein
MRGLKQVGPIFQTLLIGACTFLKKRYAKNYSDSEGFESGFPFIDAFRNINLSNIIKLGGFPHYPYLIHYMRGLKHVGPIFNSYKFQLQFFINFLSLMIYDLSIDNHHRILILLNQILFLRNFAVEKYSKNKGTVKGVSPLLRLIEIIF